LFIFSSIVSIFISNCQAFAVQGIWRDYDNLKELVKDIRNGDKDDDKMNYDKFKDSNVYKSANQDFRKCVDLANRIGEKLGDYEIVRCYENTNYFKEKYVDDDNQKVDHQSDQNVTNQNGSEQAVQQEEVQLAENNNQSQQEQEQGQQQEQQNVTNQNQNQNGSEQAVQQEEVQLAENNNQSQQEQEQGQQQEQQNVTNQNQNQNGSEQAVQQEVQLAENNTEVQGQQEQNVTNQNQTSNERKIQSESNLGSNDGCDPSYPDICITTYSEKLSCADIPFRNFKVVPPDSRGFDSDSDGLGCEG
jgi:DNA polymerase III gamma/tau subunit